MENVKSILVVLDPSREPQPALGRAMVFARQTGARVKVFLSIYDFSYEMTTMLSAEEREAMRRGVIHQRHEWMEDLVAPYRDGKVQLEVKALWHNRPYEAILREVVTFGHDLIVKATHTHDKLKAVIFTPTDWHLIRKSAVPVLLVKEHEWRNDGHIIAAINAGTEDEAHLSLNHRITESALKLAGLSEAHVHLVNAYPGTPINIAIEIPDFDPAGYGEAVRDYHVQEMAKHAERYAIPAGQCHVVEGLPEDAIPRVADELDAQLVVLGSVGRTGLSAALIGNTAEHIIDRLDCDVLALKPAGFVCPIQPEDEDF